MITREFLDVVWRSLSNCNRFLHFLGEFARTLFFIYFYFTIYCVIWKMILLGRARLFPVLIYTNHMQLVQIYSNIYVLLSYVRLYSLLYYIIFFKIRKYFYHFYFKSNLLILVQLFSRYGLAKNGWPRVKKQFVTNLFKSVKSTYFSFRFFLEVNSDAWVKSRKFYTTLYVTLTLAEHF